MFTLPQDALPRIQAAMAERHADGVRLHAPTTAPCSAPATLLTTDNAIDPTTGTIKLKAVFPNADNRLWPGQFVNVRLQLDVQRERPDGAVGGGAARPGRPVRLRRQARLDGRRSSRSRSARTTATTAVVTKGLDDGAKVVVNGMSRLQDGSRVDGRPDAKPGELSPDP